MRPSHPIPFIFALSILLCSCVKSLPPSFSVNDLHNAPIVIDKVYAAEPFLIDSATLSIQTPQLSYSPEDFTTLSETLHALKKQNIQINAVSPNKEAYFDFGAYYPNMKDKPVSIFLFFNICSEKDKKVVLGFNFAQQIEVWMDSEKIFAGMWKRNIKKQIEDHVPVMLKKGDHQLVVRLSRQDNHLPINHLEFYCSIQDASVAQAHYKDDYWCDYIINPVVEANELSVYLGPYADTDSVSFALYDMHETNRFTIKKEISSLPCDNRLWQIAIPEALPDGLYKSKLTLPNTVLEEYCFVGKIDRGFDELMQKLDAHSNREIHRYTAPTKLRWQKLKDERLTASILHDLAFNSRNMVSVFCQLQNISEIVFNNRSFRTQSGTFLKEYTSSADDSSQYYIFHASPDVLNRSAKIPLVVYMPYNTEDPPIMPLSWYISDLDFLDWEMRLADQYGFALFFPYLRVQNVYNSIADSDFHEALNDLKRYYEIDEENIYLMGGCTGGTKALMAAFHNPNLAAGIGFMNGDFPNYLYQYLPKLSPDLPIFISHSYNNKEHPIRLADKFVAEAEKYNSHILYQKMEKEGHFNPAENRDEVIFRFFSDIYKSKTEGL